MSANEDLKEADLFPLENRLIADIGCGVGTWLLTFLQWGARPENLHGIDLDENRIARARSKLVRSDLRVGDACVLPWPAASFNENLKSRQVEHIIRHSDSRFLVSTERKLSKVRTEAYQCVRIIEPTLRSEPFYTLIEGVDSRICDDRRRLWATHCADGRYHEMSLWLTTRPLNMAGTSITRYRGSVPADCAVSWWMDWTAEIGKLVFSPARPLAFI
jgi:hypothetical protein